MEIPRWSERHVRHSEITLWELLSLHTIWTLTTLVMHRGGRCLDLRVMSCLCCKWLEWWRCNRVWPFKIACGQWLALCGVLCLQASLPGLSCHRDQGEAQMFPAALPNFIVSLPVFTAAWYDLTPCTRRSRPVHVRLLLHTSSAAPRHVRPVWCWCSMSVTYFSAHLHPHNSLIF